MDSFNFEKNYGNCFDAILHLLYWLSSVKSLSLFTTSRMHQSDMLHVEEEKNVKTFLKYGLFVSSLHHLR